LLGLRYQVFDRDTQVQVELFREENVPLETEEAKLAQQYQKLSGSLTVQFRGDHSRDFPDAIKNGRRAICDIETAVRSDTLCQLALIAVKQGRKLQWDPQVERFVNDDAANASLQLRPFGREWKLPKV
jgi:hypothetical protein